MLTATQITAVETLAQATRDERFFCDRYVDGLSSEHDYTIAMGSVDIARQNCIDLHIAERDLPALMEFYHGS
jgi:hypothetical protein